MMPVGRPGRGAWWLAGIAGFGVAAGAVLVAQPAEASTTVTAQLALTGIVTGMSPIGGSVVGVHPGDSVDLTAAPAGLSTQGLNNLGIPLGDVLGSIAGNLVGYQVVVHLPATFPGGKRDVTLGPCGGRSDLRVGFSNPGTYDFTWSAYSVTALPLLGCRINPLTLDGRQLSQAGIALDAGNRWVGKIVVATNPPAGGIAVQLPAVSVAPSLGPVQLPSVGRPGANLPTVAPTTVSPGLPSSTGRPASFGNSANSGGTNGTPSGGTSEASVVPDRCCDEVRAHNPDAGPDAVLLNGLGGGTGAVPHEPGVGSGATPVPTRGGEPADLAARTPPAEVPVLLAILAIIALSVVTATYARLYLIRRQAGLCRQPVARGEDFES
jgi:hypothetical protein